MSLLEPTLTTARQGPRKRTSSFSTPSPNPRPLKTPKMTQALRRTPSYTTLPGFEAMMTTDSPPSSSSSLDTVPYHRTLRYYKEQRERRKAMLHRRHTADQSSQITIRIPSPVPVRAPIPTPHQPFQCPRASSPLVPKQRRTLHPPRACFPRSKPEPNLYKMAITTNMRRSPNGQKILLLGPRLAVNLLTATMELERFVAAQQKEHAAEEDRDISMEDGTSVLTKSWVIIPQEDWEMLDCGA